MEKWGMVCKDCCHDVMECVCLGLIDDRAPDLSDPSNRPPRALYTIQDLYRKVEEFRFDHPRTMKNEYWDTPKNIESNSVLRFLSWLISGKYEMSYMDGEDR